jgi:glycolate oxidase FAD binding subunit
MTPRPQSVADVQDAVQSMARIHLRAGGTKSAESDAVLDLSGLTGITDYSPEECVFTARAGTSIHEIDNALRARSVSPVRSAVRG